MRRTAARRSTAEEPAGDRDGGAVAYDAFISYSHAADGRLAPALQAGLRSLGKPWYRRRALRVFRDQTSLSATPELWPSIEAALASSRFFVLLLSPEAAASPWVEKEVAWWRAHRSAHRTLLVVTTGNLDWDDAAGDFVRGASVPPSLRGWYASEPLWVDLGWASTTEDVSLRNPRFRDCVADLAAPVHGLPKEDLVGEDVRQHRRARRTAIGAVSALALLTLTGAGLAAFALVSRSQAIDRQRTAESLGLASSSRTELARDPQLALLLALRAHDRRDTPQAENALRHAAAGSRLLAVLSDGAGSPAHSASYSPDGRWIVSGGEDGAVRRWPATAATGAQPEVLSRQDGPVHEVRYAPDGRRLAAIGADGRVRLWAADAPERDPVVLPGRPPAAPRDLAFSGDGRWILSASEDGLRTWPLAAGPPRPPRFLFAPHTTEAALSPDGRRIYSGNEDGVLVWDAAGGPRQRPAVLPAPPADALALSSRGRRLVSAHADGGVRVWRAARGATPVVLPGVERAGRAPPQFSSVELSPDGRRIAGAGSDGGIPVWAASGGPVPDPPVVLRGHRGAVSTAAFSPDGARIVSAGADGSVRVWDAPGGADEEAARLAGPEEPCADVSPDGRRVAAGGSGELLVWEVAGGAVTREPAIDEFGLYGCPAFSPDGSVVAADDAGGSLVLLDVGGGTGTPRTLPYDAVSVGEDIVFTPGDIAFSPDGGLVAASGVGGVLLWRTDREAEAEPVVLREPRNDVYAIGFSPDGEHLATAGDDGRIRVWDTGAGADQEPRVLGSHGAVVYSLAVSGDGTRIASAGGDGQIRVWPADGGSGARPLVLSDHRGTVSSIAFSPDGERLVSGGDDGRLRVWDLRAGPGQEALVLPGHSPAVTSVAYSPDGRLIVSAGEDGLVRLVRCVPCGPVEDLVPFARSRAVRDLTPDERANFLG
jgi:WD40 repeat protein